MDRPTDSLRGLPYTTVLELMGVESMHDEETTERLKDLDDGAAKVRADTATFADFEASARMLPDTEDIAMTLASRTTAMITLRST